MENKIRQDNEKGIAIDPPQTTIRYLTALPPEIIFNIFANLPPLDLNSISSTCCKFHRISHDDVLWKPIVLASIPPGANLTSPSPCDNYRELYWGHDPYWFILKQRIWCNDLGPYGGLILTRYNPTNGDIEGIRMAAPEPDGSWSVEPWERDSDIAICQFDPVVKVHRETPIISIPVREHCRTGVETRTSIITKSWEPRNTPIRDMAIPELDSTLCMCTIDPTSNYTLPFKTIPASSRTVNTTGQNNRDPLFLSILPRFDGNFPVPRSRDEICQYAFRLQRSERTAFGMGGRWSVVRHSSHYASIDPAAYTPTNKYPFRGIWIGDYSLHGGEFLLLRQEDSPDKYPQYPFHAPNYDNAEAEAPRIIPKRNEDETESEFQTRSWKHMLSNVSGKLLAVKLTGDPNVPMGEVSFYSEDVSAENSKGVIEETEFLTLRSKGGIQGAGRVVKGEGHISDEHGDDEFIETEIFLLSPDLIAQHWKRWRYICFYRRVSIDRLVDCIGEK